MGPFGNTRVVFFFFFFFWVFDLVARGHWLFPALTPEPEGALTSRK